MTGAGGRSLLAGHSGADGWVLAGRAVAARFASRGEMDNEIMVIHRKVGCPLPTGIDLTLDRASCS